MQDNDSLESQPDTPPEEGTVSPEGGTAGPSPSLTPVEANIDARHFNCKNCGANLLYKPGTQQIKCPYCGTINDIPAEKEDSDYLKENDFLSALEDENKRRENAASTQAEAVRCTACGAVTTLSPDRTSERCPYCGSPLALQNHYGVKLSVQAVLPFTIPSEKALTLYRDWLASRWFAPNDFARRATREESLAGIYMPYWTYDADTRTQYQGRRGDAYYTTESYTVMVDGRPERRTRQVRHIRWSNASGMVDVAFDDILIPASKSLPPAMADSLGPWRLVDLKPFQQAYLSGFVTETYQISLKDGFEDAKRRMEPHINQAIRRDIGGDEQRITSTSSRYDQVTFKHILLPVWLSAYRYGGETYRFIINAQTGEISGERPWSWIKITLAVLAVLAGLAVLGVIIYLLHSSGVFDDSYGYSILAAPLMSAVAAVERAKQACGAVVAKVRDWAKRFF